MKSPHRSFGWVLCSGLTALAGCSSQAEDSSKSSDAATPDSGKSPDGATPDSGTSTDGATTDSGTSTDAATTDSGTPTDAASGGTFPPDTTLEYVATTTVARPDYLVPVIDATWGTKITRISNVAGVHHAYSRISPWNSDQSKILLGSSYPGRMLDGTTYADLGSFNQRSWAMWSNTDPNKLYGTDSSGNGARLYSQDATTGASTMLHDFAPAYTQITIGDGEGGVSDDDQLIALIGTTSSGTKHLISYNIKTNTVLGDIVAMSGIDNCQASRKGNYVTACGDAGTRRYTADLSDYITLFSSCNHGDNALDASGNEIFVGNSSPEVNAFLLSDGTKTQLLPGKTMFDPGHTSGRNINRPGWIYLSNYDPTYYGTNQSLPGKDQLVAVKTDGSGTVEVFGFAHHSILSYESEPHAVPSRDGTRVMFASEWGGTETYAYVASMP